MPAQDYSIHVDVCTVSSVYVRWRVRNSDIKHTTNRLIPFRNRHLDISTLTGRISVEERIQRQ